MQNPVERNIQQPLGIYVVCVGIILAHGGLHFLIYFKDFMLFEGDVSFFIIFVSLFLIVFNVAAAFWAMNGDNLSRIFLLISESLNVPWFLYLAINTLAFGPTQKLERLKDEDISITPLLISAFVFFISWFYLMTGEAAAYYKHLSKLKE